MTTPTTTTLKIILIQGKGMITRMVAEVEMTTMIEPRFSCCPVRRWPRADIGCLLAYMIPCESGAGCEKC